MFRIWFTNVDTLTLEKHLELKRLIDSTPNPPDLIALSEAKPKSSLLHWNPLWHIIQRYRLLETNMNPNDTGRSILIHIRDGIDFQEQNRDPAVLENQIVDLKLGDVKYCLMSVYRSPMNLKPDSKPMLCRAPNNPLALQDQVISELAKLEAHGIIKQNELVE